MRSFRLRAAGQLSRLQHPSTRSFSVVQLRYSQQTLPAPQPLPYVYKCPEPTCSCLPTPADLDIDHKSPLLNTMAAYSEQLVICSGQDDWSSRIEDDAGPAGDFLRGVKSVIGKGGEAFDPFNNVSTIMCSLPSTQNNSTPTTSALLFPSFIRLPSIPHDHASYSALAAAYLKAAKLHPAHGNLTPEELHKLTRDPSRASELPPAEPITDITILICGHGGRDQRCGIMGPLLREQFRKELERRGIKGDVGVISHIGGHKYAGNVIVYVPPGWKYSPDSASVKEQVSAEKSDPNALGGTGVWYGRVDPSHVEGIVQETLLNGRIVVEHFRGGVSNDGRHLGRLLEDQMKKERGDTGELKLKPRIRGR